MQDNFDNAARMGADVQSIPSHVFTILCVASAVTAVSFTGLQSVLPSIGRAIGLPDSLVSAVFSLASVLVIFASPYWARQSDIRGRKSIILVGVAGFILSMGGCALAVSAGINHLYAPMTIFFLLFFARGLNGAIAGATQPATQAFVADHTSRDVRTQSIAALAGASGVGTVVGPLVAPMLAKGYFGLATPLYAFATGGVLVFLFTWFFIPDDRQAASAVKDHGADGKPVGPGLLDSVRLLWANPSVRRLLIFAASANVMWMAVLQTLGFAIIDKVGLGPMGSLSYITTAMIAGSLATVVGQWVLIPIFKPMPAGLLRWGCAVALTGSLLLVLVPYYWAMVVGFTLFSLGFSFIRPGLSAAASLSVTGEGQASVAGVMVSVMGGASFVAPFFVLLYSFVSFGPFLVSVATMAALFLFAVSSPHLRYFHPPV